MRIWIDDIRQSPEGWSWCISSEEAIHIFKYCLAYKIPVEEVSFDHDLGGEDSTRRVILWMCENEFWPEKVYVHTQNPVGREWIVGMVNRYGPGISA